MAKGTVVCPPECWLLGGSCPCCPGCVWELWANPHRGKTTWCQGPASALPAFPPPTPSSSSFLDFHPRLSLWVTPWGPQERGTWSEHRDPDEPSSAWHSQYAWWPPLKWALLPIVWPCWAQGWPSPPPPTLADESHPAVSSSLAVFILGLFLPRASLVPFMVLLDPNFIVPF